VLTAAHCLDRNKTEIGLTDPVPRDQITAWRNSSRYGEGEVRTLDTNAPIQFHNDWRRGPAPIAADAAILTLKAPLASAIPAPLHRDAFGNGRAVVSGCGLSADQVASADLRATSITVMINALCQSATNNANLQPSHLCTADLYNGVCRGDSGGPLVIGSRAQPQSIGIVHYTTNRLCGGTSPRSNPVVGIFVRASAIAPWALKAAGMSASVTSESPPPLSILDTRGTLLQRKGQAS
jgi:secreted trypsin-like serine protease